MPGYRPRPIQDYPAGQGGRIGVRFNVNPARGAFAVKRFSLASSSFCPSQVSLFVFRRANLTP
jgi:hypothetical protein